MKDKWHATVKFDLPVMVNYNLGNTGIRHLHSRWLEDKVGSIQTQPVTYDIIAVNLSAMVEIWHCTEMANYIRCRAQHCQKYTSHPKKFQIKVVRNWISYKKVREHMCVPPHGVEPRGMKDCYSWNITLYWNDKIYSI